MRDGEAGPTSLAGFRRYTWWAVPGSAAFYVVLFIAAWIFDPDVQAWARVVGAAALLVTATVSVVLLSRRLALLPSDVRAEAGRLPTGWLVAGGVGAIVLAAIQLTARDYGVWAVAPTLMVAITSAFLPMHRRRVLIACSAVVAPVPGGIVSLISGDGELVYATLFPPGLLAFTLWIILGPLWAWDVAGRLNQARRLSAELAVKDERLRFAADLHDIQGHYLQVIALKSELAARLAEADPARAATEMREVQRLSTDALQDTRGVVQGYRRTTLEEEIANATRVLAAADIDARMNVEPVDDSGRLTAISQHLLGLVMREATTNVLRHSRARHAEVDYRVTSGVARLRMSNDGAVAEADSGMAPGDGLRTLADRLGAAGGELTWEHAGDRFVVAASLPADVSAETG